MAIQFPNTANDVTFSKVITGSANSSITASKPINTTIGDLLEVTVHCRNTSNSIIITDVSGQLTLITSNTTENGQYYVLSSVYYRIVDGTENTFTFNFSVGNIGDDLVIIRRVTGARSTNPIGAVALPLSSNSVSPVSGALTTTSDNSVVRSSIARLSGYGIVSNTNFPANHTGLVIDTTRLFSAGLCYGQSYRSYPTAGTNTGIVEWTNFADSVNYHVGFAYEILPPLPTRLINSLNNDTNVLNSDAVNTASITGFSPTSGTINGLILTNVSTTSNITTFTIPSMVHEEAYPKFNTSTTLTLSDGTYSVTYSAIFLPPSTSSVVSLIDPDNIDDHKLGKFLAINGTTPVTNDLIISVALELVVSPDTSLSLPSIPITTIIWHRVNTSGIVYRYITNVSAIDIISGSVITLPLFTNGLGGGTSIDPLTPLNEGSSTYMLSSSGLNTGTKAFTKPIIQATNLTSTPTNADGFNFGNTLGTPLTVVNDSIRGKVLYNTQDNSNYNSALRYTVSGGVPENALRYSSFWFKAKLSLNGVPYASGFQLKNYRWTYQDSISDNSLCEAKLHTQNNGASNTNLLVVVTNNVGNGGTNSTSYGGQKGVIDDTWFLLETFINTGTVGGDDGRMVCRLMQNGINYIQHDKKNFTLYGTSERYGWFNEQGYFGNFGTNLDGNGPYPDSREVWRDSSTQIEGWRRVDLCDSLNTMTSTFRQNQKWSDWTETLINIPSLDLTGLPTGNHTLYLREINGIDSNGNDIVVSYKTIEVTK